MLSSCSVFLLLPCNSVRIISMEAIRNHAASQNRPTRDISNYWPINHTSIISGILRVVVKEQIANYLRDLKLLSPRWQGSLQSRSCSTFQFDFLNPLTSETDKGMASINLFLDMGKVFHSVADSHLFTQACAFGIMDLLLAWLTYLSQLS